MNQLGVGVPVLILLLDAPAYSFRQENNVFLSFCSFRFIRVVISLEVSDLNGRRLKLARSDETKLFVQDLPPLLQVAESLAEIIVLEVAASVWVLVLLGLVSEVNSFEIVEIEVVHVRVSIVFNFPPLLLLLLIFLFRRISASLE